MKKYYIFSIKKDYANSYVLYKMLENLYYLKHSNIDYGLELYNQICNYIDKDKICICFNKYIKINNKKFLINELLEESVVNIRPSCITYNTNLDYPPSFNKLGNYDRNLFICDFSNKKYFWLNKHNIIKTKYTLI